MILEVGLQTQLELQWRCQQVWHLLEALMGRSISRPFSALRSHCISWLAAPFSIFKVSHLLLCSVIILLSPWTLTSVPLLQGLLLHEAHQGQSPHLEVYWFDSLVTRAESLTAVPRFMFVWITGRTSIYSRNLGLQGILKVILEPYPSSQSVNSLMAKSGSCASVWYSRDAPWVFTELNCFKGIEKLLKSWNCYI